jgi:hypothetical protein
MAGSFRWRVTPTTGNFAAWRHADGEGLNLTLTALPLNGRPRHPNVMTNPTERRDAKPRPLTGVDARFNN